ncbi:MAG TPA: hypothetical protein VFB83_03945 [Propionibacteriaceae bacterium]|jgi:hypothetical protein|nr:hypothetical protein [Propionibacteriaceae bacterium]
MSLINDYTFQGLNDQRERDLAKLAERNRRVRLALNGHEGWLHRVFSRRERRRIAVAAPQHRVAH